MRLNSLALVCIVLATAVGCEPSAEDDEVGLAPGVSIEAPSESKQRSDYTKYAEEVCVKSPVGQDLKGEAATEGARDSKMLETAKKD